MRPISIVGIGQLPVKKQHSASLRVLGATVVRMAMQDAGLTQVDALFSGNMLGDELQGQKQLGALIADESGLHGIEALDVRAATASGAAALRMAYIMVASGEVDSAIAVGVEKMSDGDARPALDKSLDAEQEVPAGATMISQNAELMRMYLQRYDLSNDSLVDFAVNAHCNGNFNPNALFAGRSVSARDVRKSRIIEDPIKLMDCSPICDGAAAVVLMPSGQADRYSRFPVKILASSVATDRFRLHDRADPLRLEAARSSSMTAFRRANVGLEDVSLFEVHDAFSIMACLSLESVGFAAPGDGWRMAANGEIGLHGKIPIATMGGLKARGHPIGATALYQTCEIVLQLTRRAGRNQVNEPKIALLQSVGGGVTTMLTHVLGV